MTPASPPTILLVEDETLISQLIADWLGDRGFAVHEAGTADAAFAYLDAGGDADVLFTDIILPGGMDGLELARLARRLRPDLPIVYASGRYGQGELGEAVPCSVYLAKPYDPADLCTIIERLTASRTTLSSAADQPGMSACALKTSQSSQPLGT